MSVGMGVALGGAALMLLFPQPVMEAAQEGCALWAQAVMPGLLPFLVCLLYATGRLALKPGNACGVTGLSRPARRVMLMGLITGSPGGARLMGEAAARGLLSPGDGLRLALWGGSMSPMFILGTLPLWLQQPQVGWRLLAAHWLGVFVAGEAGRLIPCKPCPLLSGRPPEKMTLPRAIEGAVRALLVVCGCMVMGCVIGALIKTLCPRLPRGLGALCQCLVEVTAGCRELIALGAPPWTLAGAVSLGGFSLFLQNLAFWPRGWFHPGWVVAGRLLACLVSLLAGWALFQNTAAPAFVPGPLPIAHPSLGWLIGYLCLCLIPLSFRDAP